MRVLYRRVCELFKYNKLKVTSAAVSFSAISAVEISTLFAILEGHNFSSSDRKTAKDHLLLIAALKSKPLSYANVVLRKLSKCHARAVMCMDILGL